MIPPPADVDRRIALRVAELRSESGFTLDELDEQAIRDPRALELCAKAHYAEDPNSRFPRYYSGEVVIETNDGRTLRHREEYNRGSDGQPLSAADVERLSGVIKRTQPKS